MRDQHVEAGGVHFDVFQRNGRKAFAFRSEKADILQIEARNAVFAEYVHVCGQPFCKSVVERTRVVIARQQIKLHVDGCGEDVRNFVFGTRGGVPVVKQVARYDNGVDFVFACLHGKISEGVHQLLPAGYRFVVIKPRQSGVEVQIRAMYDFHK